MIKVSSKSLNFLSLRERDFYSNGIFPIEPVSLAQAERLCFLFFKKIGGITLWKEKQ